MKRRFLVPEVIQTSATDCGPAALKALFAGLGIYLSYGRLREACQTDVDGTSIDTLETIAAALGVDVEQRMIPVDFLLLDSSACLPAIIALRLPGGDIHFVVLWRVLGSFVQIMDPAAGRIWMHRRRFLELVHLHEQPVSAAAWEEWSRSAAFAAAVEHRLRKLGGGTEPWADPAHLDASLRVAQDLVEARALDRGAEARHFLQSCAANPDQIPPEYWTARRIIPDTTRVILRGAVVLSVSGLRPDTTLDALPRSLAAVRSEPPPRVWAPVWAATAAMGWPLVCLIALAIITVAAGTVFEALLFRGLFDLAQHLTSAGQRIAAFLMVITFLCGLFALEWSSTRGLLDVGRHLELRLRARFLLKIPRLTDRYFQSRLISDMAFRAHALQQLRGLPELSGELVRLVATLLFTAGAICWLYPGAAVPAIVAVLASVGIPLLFKRALVERDLRVRETSAGLSRFYLDGLLGTHPIQAHGAGATLLAAQAPQLRQWADAGLRQRALVVQAEVLQVTLSFAAIIWLAYSQTGRSHVPGGFLLLMYWSMSIPAIGRQLAAMMWRLPPLRNILLRFLEPLGAHEEERVDRAPAENVFGVQVDMNDVSVVTAGQLILDRVNVHAAPGEHVGIVGLSGAGKSSIVGLLLGWHQPAHGRILVDGSPLDAGGLVRLRQETAWIDPQVHVFGSTLFENLLYGNGDGAMTRIGAAIDNAGLVTMLQRLPAGLQTPLGEGGTMVSGGEGQRVRIGRALARSGVRLAILDEPARGLDRQQRRDFLKEARRHFAGATLFAITHDVVDTLGFDRVLVIEDGRIAEEGPPRLLYDQRNSKYRALIDEQQRVDDQLWSHARWRRFRMTDGVLEECVEGREWTLA